MPDARREGWRVFWHHPTGRDQCIGSWWADRADADDIAAGLRRAGCRNVTVRRSLGNEKE